MIPHTSVSVGRGNKDEDGCETGLEEGGSIGHALEVDVHIITRIGGESLFPAHLGDTSVHASEHLIGHAILGC